MSWETDVARTWLAQANRQRGQGYFDDAGLQPPASFDLAAAFRTVTSLCGAVRRLIRAVEALERARPHRRPTDTGG